MQREKTKREKPQRAQRARREENSEEGKEREPPGAKGEAMTGEELNKIHTEFVFFKASPDESTVGVV